MFTFFPQLPAEIRNKIWNICVSEYPARIVDLTKDTTKFKSKSPAPSFLYVCQESRSIAKESYTTAFGTPDVAAKTWIDFDRDILYLSWDFCQNMPKQLSDSWVARSKRFLVRKKDLRYSKTINPDFAKIKDLAIGGVWHQGSTGTELVSGPFIRIFDKISISFPNLQRVAFVDTQDFPDYSVDLTFFNGSLDPIMAADEWFYFWIMNFRQRMFWTYYFEFVDVWEGSEPWLWFEFGTLVERKLHNNPIIRPRRIGSRLTIEEDCVDAFSDTSIREMLDGYRNKMGVSKRSLFKPA